MVDSTENFVEYGTPLDRLEEEELPSKKPVMVQDQIAVDDQGRRRFHGAFTGGFSAGYYNTVGSKEGWTPTEFKSSRQNRAEGQGARKTQNAHDFMDDEDLGAFGIAPQIIRATTDFEQRESRKPTRSPAESGPIPGTPVLEQIIQPVKDTIGIRILQRMGWRPGKGVGPRVTKAERKTEREKRAEKKRLKAERAKQKREADSDTVTVADSSSDVKVYGCFVPQELRKPEESDSDDSVIDLSQVTFAPDEVEDPLCNPKENTFGLGYSGLDRSALSFGAIDLFGADIAIKSRVENRKLNIRGEAFGIGAFEDADEEVYHRNDMSQYDFSLETTQERKKRRGNERQSKNDKKVAKEEEGVLPGFVRAKNPVPPRKFFAPPPLPKNFEPKHYIRRSRFDQPPPAATEQSSNKKLGLDRHRLTIEDRQVLLGEEKIPLTPQEQQEVEEKTKQEAEEAKKQMAIDKVERLRKFTEVLQAYSANKATPQPESSGGFKPFMKNPEKQERYEQYMTLVAAGFPESLKDLQPLEMTEWERERERMEFERASALYRPMGSVISSRFVSAQSHDISHLVPTRETQQEKDPTQDPKVASKMGLFGKLTHKVYEWHADRLLSKRFNVPHPYPESKMIGVVRLDLLSTVKPASKFTVSRDQENTEALPTRNPVKKSLFDNLDFSKPPPGLLPVPVKPITSTEEDICPPGTESEAGSEPNVQETKDLVEKPSEPLPIKPSIDLFKEIFENSSSEEDETAELHVQPQSTLADSTPSRFESAESKTSREYRSSRNHENRRSSRDDRKNSDPDEAHKSKGIFDNLDFSKLNNPAPPTTLSAKPKPHVATASALDTRDGRKDKATTSERMTDDEDPVDVDVYGPLPPHQSISIKSSMSKDIKPDLSKGTRGNPINSTLASSERKSKLDEDEVVWVEVPKGNGTQERTRMSDNVSKERKKRTHKHKKLKKELRLRPSSSSKGKKSKKGKGKKSKKRPKRDSSTETSSGSENETASDSSEDSSIQIHSSYNNKALLSKLRELTRSK